MQIVSLTILFFTIEFFPVMNSFCPKHRNSDLLVSTATVMEYRHRLDIVLKNARQETYQLTVCNI